MCGIIGYRWCFNAPDVLIEGLRALEYRGYDSSGIACFANNGQIVTIKKAGKVNDLAKILPKDFTSTCGRDIPDGQPTEACLTSIHIPILLAELPLYITE